MVCSTMVRTAKKHPTVHTFFGPDYRYALTNKEERVTNYIIQSQKPYYSNKISKASQHNKYPNYKQIDF